MAPELRKADAMASERFKIAPFRQLTLPGKINIMSPEGVLRSVPGLPGAVGTAVSGAGKAAEGIGAIVSQSPKAIVSATSRLLKPQIVDENKAEELIRKFNGDVEAARQYAKEHNMVIPTNVR